MSGLWEIDYCQFVPNSSAAINCLGTIVDAGSGCELSFCFFRTSSKLFVYHDEANLMFVCYSILPFGG